MSTTDEKLDPRLVVLENVDTDTIVVLTERESYDLDFDESDADFERSGDTRILRSPTTEAPSLSLSHARDVDGSALDEFGIRDDADEGKYVRSELREWDAAEIHIFELDADIEEDEPAQTDRVEDIRWNASSIDYGDEGLILDVEGEIEGDIYLNYDPAA